MTYLQDEMYFFLNWQASPAHLGRAFRLFLAVTIFFSGSLSSKWLSTCQSGMVMKPVRLLRFMFLLT